MPWSYFAHMQFSLGRRILHSLEDGIVCLFLFCFVFVFLFFVVVFFCVFFFEYLFSWPCYFSCGNISSTAAQGHEIPVNVSCVWLSFVNPINHVFLEWCLSSLNLNKSSFDWKCLFVKHYAPNYMLVSTKWASARQNLQYDMCDQPRIRSAYASAQSDQSLRWSHVHSTAS